MDFEVTKKLLNLSVGPDGYKKVGGKGIIIIEPGREEGQFICADNFGNWNNIGNNVLVSRAIEIVRIEEGDYGILGYLLLLEDGFSESIMNVFGGQGETNFIVLFGDSALTSGFSGIKIPGVQRSALVEVIRLANERRHVGLAGYIPMKDRVERINYVRIFNKQYKMIDKLGKSMLLEGE